MVKGSAERLLAKLGRSDQRKLDEYLTGVRELEQRLQLSAKRSKCSAVTTPIEANGETWDLRLRQMSELMVLAFQCDLTRIITFMKGQASSMLTHPFLNYGDGHHQLSHHDNRAESLAALQAIDTWEIEQLGYVLEKMKAVKEPGGTMLDNSIVLFSSEIADGDNHIHTDLPVLLAGRAGGRLRTGRHIRYASGTPIANLFISILNALGVDATTFGDDGAAPLPDLA